MGDEDRPKQGGERGFRIVGEGADPEHGAPPGTTFGTFVLSLSASALAHLGEAALPESEERFPVNLELARQTIDILEMLRSKTRGNLDSDETRLLDAVIHDLKMRFVRVRSEHQG